MSEENRIVELNDEELENVTGGDEIALKPYINNPTNLKGKYIDYLYPLLGPSSLCYCYGKVSDVIVSGSKVTIIVDGREVPFNQIIDVYNG